MQQAFNLITHSDGFLMLQLHLVLKVAWHTQPSVTQPKQKVPSRS